MTTMAAVSKYLGSYAKKQVILRNTEEEVK